MRYYYVELAFNYVYKEINTKEFGVVDVKISGNERFADVKMFEEGTDKCFLANYIKPRTTDYHKVLKRGLKKTGITILPMSVMH